MGERAILIEFRPEIKGELLEKLLFYKKLLKRKYSKQKVEVTNAYSSILISYPVDIENIYSVVFEVKQFFYRANIDKKHNSHLFYIPVCYEKEFGLDLEYISKEKDLAVDHIIQLHTSPIYTVYFTGFLPGFLYLGGLDKKLIISRKKSPREKVEKGAVGIGENQTGIYPKSSPGGWQIIGNSPLEFFEKNSDPPCQIFAGDKIKFFSVSSEEYLSIKSQVQTEKYILRKEKYDGRN